MKKMGIIAFGLIVFGYSSVAYGLDSQPHPSALEGKELLRLFPGKYKAEVAGYDMLITGSSNGMLKGQAFNRQDHGKWWVEKGSLCISWSNWTDGKPMCGKVVREGGWFMTRNAKGEGLKFQRIRKLAATRITRNRRRISLGRD